MGTKAIFKIYDNGKFVMGSWVKYDGGITSTSVFPYVMKALTLSTKEYWFNKLNNFILEKNYTTMFGDKKKPFSRQINDDGMTEAEILFWDISLSDKKLMDEGIWAEYIYEIRFTKSGVKIKIVYNSNEKIYTIKNVWDNNETSKILVDVVKWVDDIDYGLNDCNCGEDNNEITEENI